MWLKIPGFCQISSFAGPKWLKISFLSQIFNLTQNICILSNFILLRSKVVKKSQFWIKFFDPTENFWILPNFNLPGNEVVKKLNFWAKFSTQLKYSGFCPISYLQIRSGQKSHFLTKFSTWLKYSGFCQIFWILSNFILCRFKAVKNVHFEANFHPDSKFLDFAEFYPSHVLSRQSVSFSKIFTATENFRILPNFILRRSLMVKNFNFEPNFQPDSKCLHFAKFQPSQVQSGQK